MSAIMRRAASMVLACVIAGALLPSIARAQQPPPLDARISISAEQAVLGERVRITVLVQHPSDILVSAQPIPRSATLQLVEAPPPRDTVAGEVTTTRFEYVIAAYQLGSIRLEPLHLGWLRADGETGEVTLDLPGFTVRPTVDANDLTLRPLKPQLDVAGGPPAWQRPVLIGLASVGVALALAGFAASMVARRRARVVTAPAIEEPDSLEEAARARLDAMALDDPLRRGDYDEYYGTISLVVRDYLQQRFGFRAGAMTTPELQRRMVSQGVERWQARLVGGLLDRCDGAVYAGRTPDPASADHDLTVAFEIIELSRPAEETSAPVAAGGVR